jgi:hypothetical protein
MSAIPNFIIFHPFAKAYVKQHMRNGKEIGPYFTKRPPAKIKEKHLTERFIDHSESSARKTHADLEKEKRQHQSILEALKQHHDELVSKGDNTDDDGKGLSHKEKIAHLKAEIKNQETHLANKTRKQDLIKNRYEINKKQVAKKQEDSLNKKLSQYSEGQQKTIKDIHKANSEGKSKLVPGRILKGKDKDHIYLEAKHKDTGETHHIAIHQDGSLKDPQILHGGKFDSKTLSEPESPKEPKKVKVKEEIKEKKKSPKKGKKISKPDILKVKSKNKKNNPVVNTDQAKVEDWKKNGINSKAFKEWFGDSKIVDKDGKPLVVYHGTNENYDTFSKDKIGSLDPGARGSGFYFTKDKNNAEFYSGKARGGENGYIIDAYLNISNPYKYNNNKETLPDDVIEELQKIYREKQINKSRQEEKEIYSLLGMVVDQPEIKKLSGASNLDDVIYYTPGMEAKDFTQALKNLGYDGVLYKDGKEIVAFDPNQIKSVDNQGTFDKNTNDIKKSLVGKDKVKLDLIKQAKDQVAFTKAIKGGKIEDYEAYINFFPNGKYLNDAQRQLSKLEDLKKSVKEKRSRKNKRKKRK